MGLFLDMGHVREWRAESKKQEGPKSVCLYCAFSVSALVNGAESVVNIDMSKTAIDWGKENHQLNDLI